MAYILSKDLPDRESHTYEQRRKQNWRGYQYRLQKIKKQLPPSVQEYALADWHYNTSDSRCPHDAWLESVTIREPASGERSEIRSLEIEIRLLNHVTFEHPLMKSEIKLAESLKNHILQENSSYGRFKVTGITTDKYGATFSYSWYEDNYYSVWFARLENQNTWHVFHSPVSGKLGSQSVSLTIDEWLRNEKAVNCKWLTNRAWNKSLNEWRKTPI